MSIIEHELQDIKNHCESQVQAARVVTCVHSMVQIIVAVSKHRQLTACFQFPEEYPKYTILIELKSKTLSEKILSGLTKLCEKECKAILGKPQVLKVVKFLASFLKENPLCVCNDELSEIKQLLGEKDEIKLRQKTSTLQITIYSGNYFVKLDVIVPNTYPDETLKLEIQASNFPLAFQLWLMGQAKEVSRQCCQKPIKPHPPASRPIEKVHKTHPSYVARNHPFHPMPALSPVLKFLIDEIKRYPFECCCLCKERCFPDDPNDVIQNKTDPKYIDRVYCGHIFHTGCLNTYIKMPPFESEKKCPECNHVIYHEKWKNITPRLAERRWAHREAKKRELTEVIDFLADSVTAALCTSPKNKPKK